MRLYRVIFHDQTTGAPAGLRYFTRHKQASRAAAAWGPEATWEPITVVATKAGICDLLNQERERQ